MGEKSFVKIINLVAASLNYTLKNNMKKKVGLIILDGWGIGAKDDSDGVFLAKTPFFDNLINQYPNAHLTTFGKEVGLPDGQMGNSEVGHLNIGAGRIVYQDLLRINNAIEDGSFFKNPQLLKAIQTATIYGNPFEENLKNIETVLKLEAPEILRSLASTGIPTMTDLIESFPDFARLALAADRKLTETGNFKILKFLKSQLQARSTIPREGFDTDAILSRSEAFLKSNDLENSLFELSQLNDIAKEAMEPWRISAENRIETLLAVEQFVESIKE